MSVWLETRMAGHGDGTSSTVRDSFSAPQCFQLTYRSLEGYANLLSRKVEVRKCQWISLEVRVQLQQIMNRPVVVDARAQGLDD